MARTATSYIVRLYSDVYGNDTFTYDTEPEQFEGAKRLIKSAHEHTERDGIQREVTVVATKF